MLFTLIVTLFLFGAIIASAWDENNPAHIEEYIHYVASKEGVPVGEALAIANCESRYRKNALRDSINNPENPHDDEYSVGIYQINLKYHNLSKEEAYNPFRNISYAMDLYWQKGRDGEPLKWRPWRNCAKANGLFS